MYLCGENQETNQKSFLQVNIWSNLDTPAVWAKVDIFSTREIIIFYIVHGEPNYITHHFGVTPFLFHVVYADSNKSNGRRNDQMEVHMIL